MVQVVVAVGATRAKSGEVLAVLDDAHEFSSHELTSMPRLFFRMPGLTAEAFSDLVGGGVADFRLRRVSLPDCAYSLIGRVHTLSPAVAASFFAEVE